VIVILYKTAFYATNHKRDVTEIGGTFLPAVYVVADGTSLQKVMQDFTQAEFTVVALRGKKLIIPWHSVINIQEI
jgi:hypothetical protein